MVAGQPGSMQNTLENTLVTPNLKESPYNQHKNTICTDMEEGEEQYLLG